MCCVDMVYVYAIAVAHSNQKLLLMNIRVCLKTSHFIRIAVENGSFWFRFFKRKRFKRDLNTGKKMKKTYRGCIISIQRTFL